LRNNNSRWQKPRYESRGFNERPSGLYVEVRGNDVNKALRKFKKKVAESGILQDYKEKQFYTKPSEKRRKAKAAGRKRMQKAQQKATEDRGY
tara:strand:- start:54 stop:329 length:276 start_codon:yes stop_codon:yes gene_type:complete